MGFSFGFYNNNGNGNNTNSYKNIGYDNFSSNRQLSFSNRRFGGNVSTSNRTRKHLSLLNSDDLRQDRTGQERP